MKTFYLLLFISLSLIIGGFFCPPMGVIDGSVITAVGLLLMFAVAAQIPTILQYAKEGRSIRLSKGDFSAEVSNVKPFNPPEQPCEQ